MKRHLSVAAFYVRNSIHKILAALLLLAAVESVVFYFVWKHMEKQYLAGKIRVVNLELIMENSKLLVVFLVGVAVMELILQFSMGGTKNGRPEYTLYRLKITPRQAFLWQAVYNCCCFLLLWAVQATVAVGLGLWFIKTAEPSMVTSQSLFLACYRSDFLHAVLPLQDISGWVLLGSCFLTLGIAAAYQACRFEGEHRGASYVFLSFLWMQLEMVGMILQVMTLAAILLMVGYQFLTKREWKLDE